MRQRRTSWPAQPRSQAFALASSLALALAAALALAGCPTERKFIELGQDFADPLCAIANLSCVATELLAEPHGRRIHEMGPSRFEDVVELLCLCLQGGVTTMRVGHDGPAAPLRSPWSDPESRGGRSRWPTSWCSTPTRGRAAGSRAGCDLQRQSPLPS